MKTNFLFLLFIALLFGCSDNYEMKEMGGKLYRLNKRTGELHLVSGKTLIKLKIENDSIDPLGLFSDEENDNRKHIADSMRRTKEFDSLWSIASKSSGNKLSHKDSIRVEKEFDSLWSLTDKK